MRSDLKNIGSTKYENIIWCSVSQRLRYKREMSKHVAEMASWKVEVTDSPKKVMYRLADVPSAIGAIDPSNVGLWAAKCLGETSGNPHWSLLWDRREQDQRDYMPYAFSMPLDQVLV